LHRLNIHRYSTKDLRVVFGEKNQIRGGTPETKKKENHGQYLLRVERPRQMGSRGRIRKLELAGAKTKERVNQKGERCGFWEVRKKGNGN